MPPKPGQGMKPRANIRPAGAEQESTVSAEGGQEIEQTDENPGSEDLEISGEGGYNLAAIALQNLEETGSDADSSARNAEEVSEDGHGGGEEAPTASVRLAEMMSDTEVWYLDGSGMLTQGYGRDIQEIIDRHTPRREEGYISGTEETGDVDLLEPKSATNENGSRLIGVREIIAGANGIGERPDGSYGIVVTVGETMAEGVRQWAAEDGKTPEQWLSEFVANYLESWSQPARAR